MTSTIDFEALSTENRLGLVEAILGLLPSLNDWKSRTVFLAFQIAGDRPQGQIEDSIRRLRAAEIAEGAGEDFEDFFVRALDFAKDIHGVRVERRELADA